MATPFVYIWVLEQFSMEVFHFACCTDAWNTAPIEVLEGEVAYFETELAELFKAQLG